MSRKTILILICILAAGAALRIHGLAYQSLSNDELSSWQRTKYEKVTDVVAKGVRTDVHPPAYFILLHLVQKLGDSEIALRLPSMIFGVLSILLVFLVGARLYSHWEGLVSAALMAVLWCPVYFSQDARPYSMLLAFTLLSSYLLIHVIDGLRGGARLPRAASIGYVASAAVCAYTHYFGLFLVALQGLLCLVLLARSRRALARAGLLYLALAVIFAPWIPVTLEHLGRGPIWIGKPNEGFVFTSVEFIEFLFNRSAAARNIVLVFLFLLLAHLHARIIMSPNRNGLRRALLSGEFALFLWFAVPFIAIYVKSLVSVPVLTYRNLIISLPAICLLLPRTLALVPVRPLFRTAVACTGIAFLLYHLVFSMDYYGTVTKDQFREAAAYVAGEYITTPGAVIAANANHRDYFEYYFRRHPGSVRVDVDFGDSSDWKDIEKIAWYRDTDFLWYLRAGVLERGHIMTIRRTGYDYISQQEFEGALAVLYKRPSRTSSGRGTAPANPAPDTTPTAEDIWKRVFLTDDPYTKLDLCRTIIERHPGHRHAPDALFTIGIVYAEDFMDTVRARAVFEEVLRTHPGSEIAGMAKWMLDNMGKTP